MPGRGGDSSSKSDHSLLSPNFLLCNQAATKTNRSHQASDSFGGSGSGNTDGSLLRLAAGRQPPLLRHRRLFVEGSVWPEDTLSPEETEVISPHAAQLCELCKHTPPPQPKDKKKKWRWRSRGEMRKGYWDLKGHAGKNIGSLFFFLQKYPTMTKGSGLSFY